VCLYVYIYVQTTSLCLYISVYVTCIHVRICVCVCVYEMRPESKKRSQVAAAQVTRAFPVEISGRTVFTFWTRVCVCVYVRT
jgi:hypothetical protein